MMFKWTPVKYRLSFSFHLKICVSVFGMTPHPLFLRFLGFPQQLLGLVVFLLLLGLLLHETLEILGASFHLIPQCVLCL